MLETSEHEETKKKVKKKRPRTKGLKKALKEEKGHNLLDEDLDMDDKISLEINEDREYWIDKVKKHLEKLLDEENGDNRLLRHMADHYQIKNMICNIMLKQLKNKLKETLKDKNERDNLEILVEASMRALNTSFCS